MLTVLWRLAWLGSCLVSYPGTSWTQSLLNEIVCDSSQSKNKGYHVRRTRLSPMSRAYGSCIAFTRLCMRYLRSNLAISTQGCSKNAWPTLSNSCKNFTQSASGLSGLLTLGHSCLNAFNWHCWLQMNASRTSYKLIWTSVRIVCPWQGLAHCWLDSHYNVRNKHRLHIGWDLVGRKGS